MLEKLKIWRSKLPYPTTSLLDDFLLITALFSLVVGAWYVFFFNLFLLHIVRRLNPLAKEDNSEENKTAIDTSG